MREVTPEATAQEHGAYLIERDYGDGETLARLYKTANDEYIRVEANADSISLGWSTRLTVADAIDALADTYAFRDRPGDREAVVHTRPGRAHLHLAPRKALDYARKNSGAIRAMRADFAEFTFSWKMPSNLGAGGKYAQIVLQLDTYDESSMAHVLAKSATPEIKRVAPDVVTRVGSIFLEAQQSVKPSHQIDRGGEHDLRW
ncbi:hypothetical protein [Streptomyces sp. NPDC017993]|uniref:hypothetical protein n=1 Tax=Streptomyces sp. NPDC017993 TaxID=3365027 RepID=UPI0037A11C3D